MHSTSDHPWSPSQQRKPGDRCSDFSRCFAHFALHSSLFASRGRESCCVGCATLRRRERYQVVRKPTGSVLHVLSHQRRPDDQELRWKDPRSTRRQRLAYKESPQTLYNHCTAAGDSYPIAIIYSRGLSELSGAFDSYVIAISADSSGYHADSYPG